MTEFSVVISLQSIASENSWPGRVYWKYYKSVWAIKIREMNAKTA